jgi:hypothetical protein
VTPEALRRLLTPEALDLTPEALHNNQKHDLTPEALRDPGGSSEALDPGGS